MSSIGITFCVICEWPSELRTVCEQVSEQYTSSSVRKLGAVQSSPEQLRECPAPIDHLITLPPVTVGSTYGGGLPLSSRAGPDCTLQPSQLRNYKISIYCIRVAARTVSEPLIRRQWNTGMYNFRF